ncbi:MAG TPA: hypothetical protein VI424_11710, partial [Terriglobales bacterium]
MAEGRILGLFHSVWDGLTSVPHGASLGELNEEFCQHITDIDTALCEAANYFNNFVRSELKKLLEEN